MNEWMRLLWLKLTRFSAWLLGRRRGDRRAKRKLVKLERSLRKLLESCEQNEQDAAGRSERLRKIRLSSPDIDQAEGIYTELKRLYMGDGLVLWCEKIVASHRVIVSELDYERSARQDTCRMVEEILDIIDS